MFIKTLKVLALSAGLTITVGLTNAEAKSFKDVKQGTWYYDDIDYLSSKNYINGYTDGTFQPNAYVTRAQAAKIIANVVEDLGVPYERRYVESFSDVKFQNWAHPYVSRAYANQIVSGVGNGKYNPDENVTRAQIAAMIDRAFQLDVEIQDTHFSDLNEDAWYYENVQKLYSAGLAKGSEGKYAPEENLTRAQIAAFVVRATDWYKENNVVTNSTHKDISTYPNSTESVRRGLENVEETFNFDPYEINYKDFKHLITEISKFHHSGYHINGWGTYQSGKIIMTYRLSKDESIKQNALVEKKADDILKQIIKPGQTDRQKVQAIHDYLVLNVRYDHDSVVPGAVRNMESQTAYGALMKGLAVCDGYARAAKLMMDKLGIENYYVMGYTKNNVLHAWNHVKIEGKDLYMDVTWDDPEITSKDKLIYKHFLISKAEIQKVGHREIIGHSDQ